LKLSDIHFHDSILRAVIETTVNDVLRFDVDYPVDWNNNKFSRAFIVFSDVQGYVINEMAFDGSPTILDYEVLSECNGRYEVKINTNAGFRSFSFFSVNIEWPTQYTNTIEEQFFTEKRDDLIRFVLNDDVKINTGEHAGCNGSVVSIISERPKIDYLVELENGQGDIKINEQSISLVDVDENET